MKPSRSPALGSRSVTFAPLLTDSRSSQVARRLADAILLGVIVPGERLPIESELAKKFGVAVVTAREALAEMRDAGLVETRRGREGGSFVTADAPHSSQKLLDSRLRAVSRTELLDAALFGEVITAGTIDRACLVCTDSEIQALTLWLAEADFSTPATAARDHGGFLLELCVLSQSPRLVREQIQFQARYGQLLWMGLSDAALSRAVADIDEKILQALFERNTSLCRELCHSLFTQLATWLLRRKQEMETA
ncbi:GntR family transcriptional regulator [Glutamicibacter sp.]|uniref:FadR/GntR family transcriptional regulator n=1 Tax=Glutamicibacter sp. TaxID=1931995 RepID=UPI0028BD32ED|nr:GntR family transcriptional regulator [Glutamicibacter sp.]